MDSLLIDYDDNYYAIDRKLGLSVLVDGESVYMSCNADLIDYSVSPPEISKNIYKYVGKHAYRPITFSLGNSNLVLRFYVGGSTEELAQKNVNVLLSYFIDKTPVVKIGDTSYEYVCSLSDFTSEYTKVKHYYEVQITCNAIKRLPFKEKPISFTSGAIQEFDYEGTALAGINVIFVVSSSNSQTKLPFYIQNPDGVITRYEIGISGSYKAFSIDGLNGKVLAGTTLNAIDTGLGNNWFSNTDIIDFPVLKSGKNKIGVTSFNTAYLSQCIVRYYPLFTV